MRHHSCSGMVQDSHTEVAVQFQRLRDCTVCKYDIEKDFDYSGNVKGYGAMLLFWK